MRNYQAPLFKRVVHATWMGAWLTAIGLAIMSPSALAQQGTAPARVGPDPTGTLVYSNTSDTVTFGHNADVAADSCNQFGDDLHLLRAGNLTWIEFTFVDLNNFATAGSGSFGGIEFRFYLNDPTDGGREPGENLAATPLSIDDRIGTVTVPAETVGACVHPVDGACITPWALAVAVDPPLPLPRDVWVLVHIPNLSPLAGPLVRPLNRNPSVGSSHPIAYLEEDDCHGLVFATHEDLGTLNYIFALHMEPSPVDTPQGSDVTVDPEPNVSITFDNVTQAGATEVTTSDTNPFPDATFEFLGVFYDINTNAEFNQQVTICLTYGDGLSPDQENALQLLHFDGSSWTDITTSRDTQTKVVCGTTNSFSVFALAHRVPHPAQNLIDDLIGQVTMLNIKQGIANSLDAKLGAVAGALDDFNSNNNAAAANAISAFINEVQAQSGGQISSEDAAALILVALDILDLL